MADPRIDQFAKIIVDYSAQIQAGDRVVIEATTAAEPVLRSIYQRILEKGAHPHMLLALPDQEELFYQYAQNAQLDYIPPFHMLAAREFDARIRIYSELFTRSLTAVDPIKQARKQKATAAVQNIVFQRGASGALRWVSTLTPTIAYANEAEMGWQAYQDFVYRACHADEADPVAYWKSIQGKQQRYVALFKDHDLVTLRGRDVDLRLSVRGRVFMNASGQHNMPDGEIYTGPVENSVEGWVRFTYPAIYQGRLVEGIELTFEQGRVVKATAQKNQDLLDQLINLDAGARYLGEFAIGTNYEIDRFTKNILFDEKIGGSFHVAIGAGYPETGSKNTSNIHWDMICDLKQDAEMCIDGELIYRNGKFLID